MDNHWDKLPRSWRESLEDLNPLDLGRLLSDKSTTHVFPLSFLALLKIVKALCIPRQSENEKYDMNFEDSVEKFGSHAKLKNLFLKHVKLKKRHEISLMADVVNDTASKGTCNAVIDFGSGLGHLVRMLGYKYDLHAAGIECQTQLTEEARSVQLVCIKCHFS